MRVALAASMQKSVNAPLKEPKEEAKVVPEEKVRKPMDDYYKDA